MERRQHCCIILQSLFFESRGGYCVRQGREEGCSSNTRYLLYLPGLSVLTLYLPTLSGDRSPMGTSVSLGGRVGPSHCSPSTVSVSGVPTLVADLVISCSSARKPYAPNSLHLRPLRDVPLPWQPHSFAPYSISENQVYYYFFKIYLLGRLGGSVV